MSCLVGSNGYVVTPPPNNEIIEIITEREFFQGLEFAHQHRALDWDIWKALTGNHHELRCLGPVVRPIKIELDTTVHGGRCASVLHRLQPHGAKDTVVNTLEGVKGFYVAVEFLGDTIGNPVDLFNPAQHAMGHDDVFSRAPSRALKGMLNEIYTALRLPLAIAE